MSEEMNKKIEELQMLESHLQAFLAQKQTVQIELNEINNAIEELKSSEGEVYKVASGFMIKSTKEKLEDELAEKKKVVDLKIESMEKQERLIENDAAKLRADISKTALDSEDKAK